MVRFLTDTAGVKDAVDEVEGTGSKIKDWAGKAALAIGGAFAVDKVVEFGKASVDAAAADAAAQANLAQQLKNSAGASDAQVKATEDWISKASKQYAVADDDLRPAMGNLVRGFGDVGKATSAMGTALDVSAGTGKDLGSVTEAMMKAAEGNTGALGRMGIATKDASGHALSMDQIMGNLATTFKGQAATAADSAAGRMANAKIQFGEFQEQIGGYLLPVLATLASFFTNTLLPAISGFVDWISAHKDIVVAALIGFGVVVGAVVVPAFISWAVAAGAAAIATLAAAAPFIAIGAVIAAVAYVIIKNWDSIKAGAETAWNFVLNLVRSVWNWISANWPLLLAILTGPFGVAVLAIQRNWDTIMGFFRGLPGEFLRIFGAVGDAITAPFRAAVDAIASAWNDTVGSLSFHIPSWVPGVGGKGFDVPDIPHLAQGGLITGDGLIYAHAGEAITPAPGGTGGPALHIENAVFNTGTDVDLLAKQVEFAVAAGMRL
jgi:hypothetical protein